MLEKTAGRKSEYFTKETGQRYLKGQSVGEICSFSLSEERLAKPMGVMTIDWKDPDTLGDHWHLDSKLVCATVECWLESSTGFSKDHSSLNLAV